jgi:multiple sugar transport system substrate-binding protein
MSADEKDRIGRRGFLQGGTAALGGLALSGALPRRARAQTASVRVLLVGDPFQYAVSDLKDNFKEVTGLTAEIESLSYDALQARLVSSFIAHKSDADVVIVDQMWTGQYLDSGWIIPLDDLIKADKDVDIGDFIPEVFYSLNTWRGKVATMPVAAYGQGVMYRKDVFAALGLSLPPAADWTWDAYTDLIGKIHGKTVNGTTIQGTVVAGQQPQPIVHMFTQLAASLGAQWFKQFPGAPWDFTSTIDSPETLEAVTRFLQLYKLGPAEAVNYNWFDAGMRYAHGDVGMFYWWTPYYYLTRNDGYMTGKVSPVRDQIAIAPLPHAKDKPQVISIGGWSLAITANSPDKQAAWKFVKWATSAATQKKMALNKTSTYSYQFSDFARKSLYGDADLLAIYPYLPVQLEALQQGNGKIARPPSPVYTTLEGIYGLNLNKVLAGDLSPKEALAETKSLFENVLKGNFLLPYKLESFNDTLDATKALMKALA